MSYFCQGGIKMAKLNLMKIDNSKEMLDIFKNDLNEFIAYHPLFCKSVFSRSSIKLFDAIRFSLIHAAETLIREDCGTESSDVDIVLKTIFEILNGEKPSGISCVKFNLKFIYFLVKELEDKATFDFPAANSILVNAIKYRESHKGIHSK